MERRAFIVATVGGLLAAPLATEAQPAGKVYRIGWLSDGPQTPSPMSVAFASYAEGRNLVIDRRYAAFNYDRLPELAADLVRLNPDVIVAGGNLSIAALKHIAAKITSRGSGGLLEHA